MDADSVKSNINYNIQQWHEKTADGDFKAIVCVICDRFILPNYKRNLSLQTLNKCQELLYPDPEFCLSEEILQSYRVSFPDVEISVDIVNSLQIQYCLLSPRSFYNSSNFEVHGFNICKTCDDCLKKNKRPKFCIANNFCFGDPPLCLVELTEVERAVITPVKTHGFCFCYTGGQKLKLQGSLSYYKVETKTILTSIAHLQAVQANIIVVVYGNVTRKQYKLAQQKSKIRVEKIVTAVRWLLDYNKQWKSMNVTSQQYDDLINTIRTLSIPAINYKLHVTFDEDPIVESDELFHVYYPDDSIDKGTGGQISIEDLQNIVHESNINHNDIACRFNLLKESVKDYKDNNLVNACLLQFPYGCGGMHEKRRTTKESITETIDIQEYVEYLSYISLPHFHEGLFSLILYNMITVQSMVRTARWQLRNKIGADMLATELTYDDVEEAINATKVARGIHSDSGQRGQQTLKAIDAICNAAPHSNDAAKKAKFKAQAIHHYFGCPTLFLTVTPDDDNHFSIQVFTAENIDINVTPVSQSSDEELSVRSKNRTKLRLKFPGICALFFELALQTVISEVLGWDIELNCYNSKGLFGKIDAFSCSIEEQGRSTLHAHFLIWMSEVNTLREELHNEQTYHRAAFLIKHLVERVSSSSGFFNDEELLRQRNMLQGRSRKRFFHECSNHRYCLPNFPDDENLLLLRKFHSIEPKLISCNFCDKKWSYTDLQDSYLAQFLAIENFSSVENENKVKRLKTTAIEYQINDGIQNISNYSIDFGYNMHNHTASCFKTQKNKKNNSFRNGKCNCRYRYPQKKRDQTIIQNVTEQLLPWYLWNGDYEMRHIKEICIKRHEYDACQNVFCPAVSKSKLTCNSNVAFLFPGPAGEYCFNYSMKGTQNDDSEPYEKLKNSIGNILAGIKYADSNHMEAVRRLLATSFKHSSHNAIRPTLASYLTRKKTRFIFSHDFVFCPLIQLKSLTSGENVSVNISIRNKQTNFQCNAIHYLCRPISLQMLSPFNFYSMYEVVNFSKKTMIQGAEPFINTNYFKHPSYSNKTNCCTKAVIKRKKKAFVQISQYYFTDSANFQCNILDATSQITEDIEIYANLVVLLFMPYRCDNDLRIDGHYTTLLRDAIMFNRIDPIYKCFLQNIQDCKANSFRFKITSDELERSAEPFHDTLNHVDANNPNDYPTNDNEIPIIGNDNIFDLIPVLDADIVHPNESFLPDDNNIIDFTMELLRSRGKNLAGNSCLPTVENNAQFQDLFSQEHPFVQIHNTNNIIDMTTRCNVKPITMLKSKIAILMGYRTEMSINFNEINGDDRSINVFQANGTAESIQNWATQCRLDTHQQRAFEIVTGYYILSYIYDMNDLEEDDEDTHIIIHNKQQLEQLVGLQRIKSKQLICFLHGPGGSGKTTVISLLQLYSREFHSAHKNDSYNRSIVLTAMTGVAATIIGGETVHSALYVNNNLKSMDPDKTELWHNTKLLVIDEISFASNEIINSVHINLGKLKDKKLLPFGGVHIIYSGDLRQLEPVSGYPLYKNHETLSSLFKIYTNCYIELHGSHRFNADPEWGNLLSRFRRGEPKIEDIIHINTRKQDQSFKMPSDMKYATFQNRDRDSINTAIFEEKVKYSMTCWENTDNFFLIFCDNIKINKESIGYVPMKQTKYFYENCGESNIKTTRTGRLDPVLKLYVGCEVMLTENIDVQAGLANGTRAKVTSIIINQQTDLFNINIGHNVTVKGIYASNVKYINLKHCNQHVQLQNFSVKPKQSTFNALIPLPVNILTINSNLRPKPIPMTATQFPIIINNATTGHKLQGIGVEKLFVHHWNYRKNWPYVVLSRVKTISGLYLRQNLSRNLHKYDMDPELQTLIEYFKHLLPIIQLQN